MTDGGEKKREREIKPAGERKGMRVRGRKQREGENKEGDRKKKARGRKQREGERDKIKGRREGIK